MNTGSVKSTNNTPSDDRYFPRWEANNHVLFQLENEAEVMQGKTKDISCAGACIAVDIPIDKQKIKLTLFLSQDVSVMIEGDILWGRKDDGDKSEIGITFTEVTPQAQDLILQHAFEVNKNQVVNHWFEGWNNKS